MAANASDIEVDVKDTKLLMENDFGVPKTWGSQSIAARDPPPTYNNEDRYMYDQQSDGQAYGQRYGYEQPPTPVHRDLSRSQIHPNYQKLARVHQPLTNPQDGVVARHVVERHVVLVNTVPKRNCNRPAIWGTILVIKLVVFIVVMIVLYGN